MIDLESFTPTPPLVILTPNGASETWAVFVRGKNGVTRVTDDTGLIRVERDGLPTLVVRWNGYGVELDPAREKRRVAEEQEQKRQGAALVSSTQGNAGVLAQQHLAAQQGQLGRAQLAGAQASEAQRNAGRGKK